MKEKQTLLGKQKLSKFTSKLAPQEILKEVFQAQEYYIVQKLDFISRASIREKISKKKIKSFIFLLLIDLRERNKSPLNNVLGTEREFFKD